MFNKEELNKIQSRLEELDKKYNDSIKQIQEFQEQKFKNLEETFSQLKEKQFFYFEEFEKSLTAFNDMNLKYKKEFDAFNVIKNNLTTKTLEKMEKEMKEVLAIHFIKLETEKKRFDELAKDIEKAKEEIKKLVLISEKVKDADFNLAKHAQELRLNDSEKLKLMKQIDDLQSLIAKMRQGRHS